MLLLKALTEEQLIRLQPYAPDNIAAEQSLSESRNRIQALQQQKRLEQAKYELSKKNLKDHSNYITKE